MSYNVCMKTFVHEYSSKRLLSDFIRGNYIFNYMGDILVQVFTSVNNEGYIQFLQKEILEVLPNAKIIGTTTNGEISLDGSVLDSTIFSISVFKDTKIVTSLVNSMGDSFTNGVNIINELGIKSNLKLLLTFTDGTYTNGEEYLNGISSINKDVIVSGAMAGDYSKFENTFVFTENAITNDGAAAAGFYNSTTLHIHTDYSFNWETVGKKHIVNKAIKNRVYEISGMATIDFYKYYLGDDIERLLPTVGVEFPLIQEIDGINVARSVLRKHSDGSLSFTGNIKEGAEIQFGHGDVQLIIKKGLENIKNIINSPIESIFIYSSMARRVLLKDNINLEILPLKEIAPISGFFTNGEFYHKVNYENSHPRLLSNTMSILSLSEDDRKIEKISPNIFNKHKIKSYDLNLHRTQAFSTLIKRTTKELECLNQNLSKRVQEEMELNLEKDNMMTLLHAQAQLGSTLEMIIHQWRQPISAITTTLSSLQVYKSAGILTNQMLDENISSLISYAEHINTTIEDFRDLFTSTHKSTNIAIDQLIAKSLTIIKPILKESAIDVQLDVKTQNIINIPVGLMMQVLLNIVKNSIDILNINKVVDPVITIKLYQGDNNNIIEIIDNGGGIPEDILPRIFDKKFTTKDREDGTGIGLHMSKKIIEEKIRGSIVAKNDNNRAIFTICIPLQDL